MTKKMSTPTNPPCGACTTWPAMTASTATARSPWMSRRWGARAGAGADSGIDIDSRFGACGASAAQRLRDPLHRDGLGRAQALREEAHAQLLEHPPRVNEARIGVVGQGNRAARVGERLLRPLELGHPRPVAPGIVGQRLEAHARALEVARQVAQALEPRLAHEARVDEALE